MTYNTLVFSGGGMQGVLYGGCIQSLHNLGLLQNSRICVGTSIGALTALAVCLDLSAAEIRQLCYKLTLGTVIGCSENNLFNLESGLRLLQSCGMFSVEQLKKMVSDIIQQKCGTDFEATTLTFSSLYQRTGKDLCVTVCCVNSQETLYISRLTHPSMPIVEAVASSMCLPFLFTPNIYNQEPYIDGGSFGHGFPFAYRSTCNKLLMQQPAVSKTCRAIVFLLPTFMQRTQYPLNFWRFTLQLLGAMWKNMNKRHHHYPILEVKTSDDGEEPNPLEIVVDLHHASTSKLSHLSAPDGTSARQPYLKSAYKITTCTLLRKLHLKQQKSDFTLSVTGRDIFDHFNREKEN